MDPVTIRLLTSWELRPVLFLLLLFMATLYTLGWQRLRVQRRSRRLARPWRLIFYWLAIIFIIVSLMSPIEVLSGDLFFMHMIQHLLLTMFAAPLLMLANPLPFLLWGLPRKLRRRFGRILSRLLNQKSRFRQAARSSTTPAIVWLIMLSTLWIWHDTRMYELALRREWAHDLEHFTFFASAALYWWLVTGAGPRIHKNMSYFGKVGYLLAGIPSTFILGVAIAFAASPLYPYYETRPRLLNLTVMDDQTIGGIIMWVAGSMMYVLAAVAVIGVWMVEQERRQQLRMRGQRPETRDERPEMEDL
ncbi:MAG: cytochrome c oxidase assembly protein [Ardenticatenaceae bacterium]|nr:cytochrome c oxidase assembly protein [Ardenticatenaceae bacterium]